MNGRKPVNARWSRFDRLGGVLVLIVGLWLAIPPRMFLRQIEMVYLPETREIVLVRETPWGDVDALWWASITLVGVSADALNECHSGPAGLTTFQAVEGNTVRYRLGPWAQPCLDQGPPFYITSKRVVLLLGFLPLRPMTEHTDIRGGRRPVGVVSEPRAF